MRLGIGRYSYKVPTGVYAIGKPETGAAMFVTCNYKLTVDMIRESLKGYNCFLLVLDTNGINVWCAAGKGTFSSRELIYQLHKNDVKNTFGISTVYLPQLGASTMEPHLVRQYSGIQVKYGPVDGKDLSAFIDNDFTATKEMRQVKFRMKERMLLAPLECILYAKYALYFIIYALVLTALSQLINDTYSFNMILSSIGYSVSALMIGTLVFPMLLPVLPFKRFSYNGYLLSLGLIFLLTRRPLYTLLSLNIAFVIGLMMLIAFITFNFTGSTTFTSQSGVEIEAASFKREVKIAGLISILVIVLEVML